MPSGNWCGLVPTDQTASTSKNPLSVPPWAAPMLVKMTE